MSAEGGFGVAKSDGVVLEAFRTFEEAEKFAKPLSHEGNGEKIWIIGLGVFHSLLRGNVFSRGVLTIDGYAVELFRDGSFSIARHFFDQKMTEDVEASPEAFWTMDGPL